MGWESRQEVSDPTKWKQQYVKDRAQHIGKSWVAREHKKMGSIFQDMEIKRGKGMWQSKKTLKMENMHMTNIVQTEQVIYIHAYHNNQKKKRGSQFEIEKEGAYGTVWKE